MKKVYQRVLDKERGDCLSACIASILELDLDQVPNFFDHIDGISAGFSQSEKVNYWLENNGLEQTKDLAFVRFGTRDYAELWGLYSPVVCIFSVLSQMFEDCYHAVVGRVSIGEDGILKFEILHDPNPKNQLYPDNVEVELIGFFVKQWGK